MTSEDKIDGIIAQTMRVARGSTETYTHRTKPNGESSVSYTIAVPHHLFNFDRESSATLPEWSGRSLEAFRAEMDREEGFSHRVEQWGDGTIEHIWTRRI